MAFGPLLCLPHKLTLTSCMERARGQGVCGEHSCSGDGEVGQVVSRLDRAMLAGRRNS
jgi:hypothetical protein